ncbi:LysR family transcriptional regulator [Bombilactobacillus bombi]|uniref:LysR family transcriptional regulator n=1 Tax=Bombilactobacillus bombi TaxID=1303590 RepID=UPI0015E62B68|nr:LysR family transcriptional regulator [Bombilactobacillus bombi]MBA1434042.1 LysR family transcriptional regulator [Bombilactobacillus bombi]
MNTRDLDYFKILVEKKSFTEAAIACEVSQPTITAAIKRLEREFSVKLIERDRVHQRLGVTRAGKILYQSATAINLKLANTQKELAATKQAVIRFGLPPIIGTAYLPQLAEKLQQKNLLSLLNIVETGSNALLKLMRSGDIDLALLASAIPLDYADLQAQVIGRRPFCIAVSPHNHLAKYDRISFKDLADEEFIGVTAQYVHPRVFQNFCHYAAIKPQIVYAAPDISWVKGLVQANLGIALLADDAILPTDCLHKIYLTDDYPERFNISIVQRQEYVLSASESQLVQELLQMNI